MKKKKKKFEVSSGSAELNVMPFIDIFSLLCTFLLFSSVFISLGIQTVQVPFLSNSTDLDKRLQENKRELNLTLRVTSSALKLTSKWSKEPIDKKIDSFTHDKEGLVKLHERLLNLKEKSKKSEKVEVFVADNIEYEDLTLVLDHVIQFQSGFEISEKLSGVNQLFPKVVLSNVLF